VSAESINVLIAVIAIVVPVLGGCFGILMAVLGWLAAGRLKHIDKKLDSLPEIDKKLAAVETKVDTHAAALSQFGERMQRVESHVSNTERIAVLEKALTTLDSEVTNKIRPHVHQISDYLTGLAGTVQLIAESASIKMPVKLPTPAAP
jgi:DNA repair ATPase RecN